MLSSALSHVLERARTRYGLDVEILDSELRNLYPETATELARTVRDNPDLRGSLRDTIQSGQPRDMEVAGRRFRVSSLRGSRLGDRGGLLAVGSTGAAARLDDASSYEIVKAAIEADLSASDALRDERQGSRRLLAILRFLRYLLDSANEADLTQALVQAAAIWFDVDARVYRRDLSGDFVLTNWLPGADPDSLSRRLDALSVGTDREVRRVPAINEPGTLPHSAGEVVVVPLAGPSSLDWVLTLSGAVAHEAESVFPVVARVVGVQLDALHARAMSEARLRFETIVRQSGFTAERLALQLVGELVRSTKADAATLTLVREGASRRIASFGPQAEEPESVSDDTWSMRADRFICALPLAPNQRAVLELRPAAGAVLGKDAADITTVFARVLQTWLVGATSSFVDPTEIPEGERRDAGAGLFEKRIEEELERAKRFDLHLSLVLVDVTAPSPAVAQIVDALRRELRGSDLLGTTSGRQVAALLTHTDDRGLDNVVARVRRRLADAADRLNIADVRVGQAAFSPDCRTAAALLSRAVREAEPIVVH